MARSKSTKPAAAPHVEVPASPEPSAEAPPRKEGARETVEAIAVAFILALLVRGFEAEAFVIPTGSMAPTLMGRHKEVNCPQCGYLYSVNASEEVEQASSDEGDEVSQGGVRPGGRSYRVFSGICVNCRYQARVIDEPSFKGDRILVNKYLYDTPFVPGGLGPKRWDVVVFRYPEQPDVSYIKRLVGLPGETIRIWYGDVFVKAPGSKDFRQERRPLEHQRAMQMMVYDDAHRPKILKDRPEYRRWVGSPESDWSEDPTTPGSFHTPSSNNAWAELRYRHVLADPVQWRAAETGETSARPPRTTLITDFYSYNTNLTVEASDLTSSVGRNQESAWLQPHWVGDLTVSARITPESSAGLVRFELIEGGVSNRCVFDLATGEAVVSHGDTELGRAPSSLKGAGSAHEVSFANVDNRLTVWVDGTPIFGDGKTYDDPAGTHPAPAAEDLAPARIALNGAKGSVSGLVLKRDIYYTQNPGYPDYGNSWDGRLPRTPVELFDFLADPKRVAALGPLGWGDYPINEDRFMMLGDNSPRSKDSRGWDLKDADWDKTSNRQKWEVPRELVTGKAFCIYWPHGKPFWPDIRVSNDFRVPFRPYFERMRWIH